MKKHLHKLVTAALLSLTLAPGANAELLFSDNFDYPVGNLKGQGEWLQSGSQTEVPIQVVAQNLVYPGYQSAGVGNAVRLTGNNNNKDQRLFHDVAKADDAKSLFASALFCVNSVPENCNAYFISFAGATAAGFADGVSVSTNGRVFVLPGTDANHFILGAGKSGANAAIKTTAEFELGKTYCLVMNWNYVEGSNNDEFSVWINPENETDEPLLKVSTGSSSINYGDFSETRNVRGVMLWQGSSAVKAAPTMVVDAVRGATDWASLFTDEGEGPGGDPSVSMSVTAVNDDPMMAFVYGSVTKKFTVRAANLAEDINLSVSGCEDLTVSPAVIAKDDAMSASGTEVTVTYAPTTAGTFQGSIDLASGDNTASATFEVYGLACTKLVNSLQIFNVPEDNYDGYLLSSTVTISYIDPTGETIYGYDMAGGVAFKTYQIDPSTIKVGDKIKNIFAYVVWEADGLPYLMPLYPGMGTLVSEGNAVNATDVNLGDIATSPELYIHRLVTIKDVAFTAEEGAVFGTSSVDITSGPTNAKGKLMPFAGTDLIGTAIPATASSVTGICRSKTIASISPRSLADIVLAPVGEPELEVTPEQLFSDEAAEIGKGTQVLRYTVEAKNLPSPASVYLTGANRNMFSIDVEEIPAGTSNTVVTVTYNPTAIGKHTARLNFDAMPTELTKGYQFTFLAYDPQNMPVATFDADALAPFSVTSAGETQVQSIEITTANLPDYGTIKVSGENSGAFTLNSTSLLKEGKTTLKITFAPKTPGTFTQSFEISGVKLPAQTLTVTGTCGGSLPEQPVEGDKMAFDTSAPLSLLNETFDNAANNKPLQLQGWINNAAKGKRAWWGYDFSDGNKAAKVTAYDSQAQIGAEDPCRMFLMTPALDFANSASKILTFRVMGQYMAEGMTDRLNVVYCDVAEGTPYYQAIEGLNIPATPDYNGEWIDYVIDFEGLDIADVFFIGFQFDSNRGRDNSAVYYIDDVTYGRTDVPQIKSDIRALEVLAEPFKPHTTTINVTGLNLSGNISLALGGANPSNFTLSATTLPAHGGSFDLTFLTDLEGVHEAYVELKAEGAPTLFIPLAYNAKASSAIDSVDSDADGRFTVYNASGIRVLVTSDPAEINALPAGLYIVNGKKHIVR